MEFTEHLAHGYFFLKNYIIKKGFADEIDWQDNLSLDTLTEQKFLEEISWVILSGGMNEKVIKKIFPTIKAYLYEFTSGKLIADNKAICYQNCITIFNHPGKINAILFAAEYLQENNFESLKYALNNDGIKYLFKFPYIGDATVFHLAKNIGMEVAKPDRHLIRIATELGYNSPHTLCADISLKISEKVSLVDLVLWRFATLDKDYLEKINWYAKKFGM
jgi:hypothetical protein